MLVTIVMKQLDLFSNAVMHIDGLRLDLHILLAIEMVLVTNLRPQAGARQKFTQKFIVQSMQCVIKVPERKIKGVPISNLLCCVVLSEIPENIQFVPLFLANLSWICCQKLHSLSFNFTCHTSCLKMPVSLSSKLSSVI